MCSYEKVGQPGYRDLGFYNPELGYRDENFPISPIMNTLPWLSERNFFFDKLALLSQQGGQNGIILPCMHFHFKSIQISFISKVTRVDKAKIVVNDTSLFGAILVLFLEFRLGHRAEISHMKRQQHSSQ